MDWGNLILQVLTLALIPVVLKWQDRKQAKDEADGRKSEKKVVDETQISTRLLELNQESVKAHNETLLQQVESLRQEAANLQARATAMSVEILDLERTNIRLLMENEVLKRENDSLKIEIAHVRGIPIQLPEHTHSSQELSGESLPHTLDPDTPLPEA